MADIFSNKKKQSETAYKETTAAHTDLNSRDYNVICFRK